MTIQKFITYTPLDINGKQLDSNCELKLNVLETSGNYLLHKDVLGLMMVLIASLIYPSITQAHVIDMLSHR